MFAEAEISITFLRCKFFMISFVIWRCIWQELPGIPEMITGSLTGREISIPFLFISTKWTDFISCRIGVSIISNWGCWNILCKSWLSSVLFAVISGKTIKLFYFSCVRNISFDSAYDIVSFIWLSTAWSVSWSALIALIGLSILSDCKWPLSRHVFEICPRVVLYMLNPFASAVFILGKKFLSLSIRCLI